MNLKKNEVKLADVFHSCETQQHYHSARNLADQYLDLCYHRLKKAADRRTKAVLIAHISTVNLIIEAYSEMFCVAEEAEHFICLN